MTSFRLAAHFVLFFSFSLSVLAQDFLSAKIITPSQLPNGTVVIAAADLNGDGVTDLVYSTGGASFSIAFGGASGFQAGGTYPQAIAAVTVADINGDGKPDLVSGAGFGSSGILFAYLNKGDGTFSGPLTTTVTTSTYIVSTRVGDFDGDGKPDVIVTTNYQGNFFFLHGNGDGTFAKPKGFSGRFYNSYQVTSAVDLNGDGKLDLVVSVIGASMVEVLLGNGDGTFQAEQPIPGNYNYSPFVADFDGDGIPDIATTAVIAVNGDYVSTSGNIYAGNGDGTFRLINSVPYGSMPGSLLGVRDVNGDGKLDLVFEDANGFTVCLGSGGVQFGPPVTYSVEQWGVAGSGIGDFDGDGLLDIVTSFNYPGTSQDVYLLKGFPGGIFEAAGAVDVGSMPSTLATSDLNHDGFPDLVASTQSGTWIYLSSSDGSYSSTSDTTILGDQIFLADLDGDGNADALYVPSSAYSTISFRHGNGDGTFADPVSGLSLYHGAAGATLGDLNGDGQPDLVGIMDNALYVWLGQGSGNFGAGVSYSYPGGYSGRTTIADVNNDGVKDVVATEYPDITVFLGSGDGQGTLNPPIDSYPGSDFVLLDVNGDGKLDLLTTSPDTNKPGVYIYLGDGTGSFGASTFISTSLAYSGIATGNLNLEGNTDLILLAESAVGVLYGDGKGGFGPEHVFPVEDGPHSPIVADWNHDGAPDIAIANSGGLGTPSPQAVSFLLNRTGESSALTLSTNPAQYGQAVNLNASIVPTVIGSATPVGSVTLSVGVTQLQGTLTNGRYSTPLTNFAVGNYSVGGLYLGDGNYRPLNFPGLMLSVVKANTTTSISPSTSPAIFGTALSCNVIVGPAFSGVPTGTVTLFDGAKLLGTMPLGAAGSATFVLSSLSQGAHVLSAQYSGDGNFIGSTSAFTEQVLYPTTISLTSNAESVLIGSKVTLTAEVASAYGIPTGNVVFTESGTTLGQAILAGGTATLSLTLSQGKHNIQASYQGDGTYVTGNSSAFSESITDFSISTTGQSLTLTAGGSGTYALQLSPLSGFSGSVALGCAGAPELATCAISPTSVPVNSGPSSATVTITTAGTSAAMYRDHQVQASAVLNATAATFLLSFVGVLAGFKTRRGPAVALFSLLLICGMSACGGSSTQTTAPRTPSGTSNLTITATTTANGVTVDHTLKLTLIVK